MRGANTLNSMINGATIIATANEPQKANLIRSVLESNEKVSDTNDTGGTVLTQYPSASRIKNSTIKVTVTDNNIRTNTVMRPSEVSIRLLLAQADSITNRPTCRPGEHTTGAIVATIAGIWRLVITWTR